MDQVLQDLSAPALVRAIEDNLFAVFAAFRAWPRAQVVSGPDILWTLTRVPSPFFNSVLRARLEPHTVDAAIAAAVARAGAREVPLFWWTGPATRPADLGTRLQAHGFTYDGDMPGMAVDLSRLPEEPSRPPELTIEPVGDRATLSEWRRAHALAEEEPPFVSEALFDCLASCALGGPSPFRLYLGRLGGEPVATSLLTLAAGVAGLYCVGTVPQARRQGIGAAISWAPLVQARAMGYHVGVLQASPMGESVYRRLGFREYCKIGAYIWSPGP